MTECPLCLCKHIKPPKKLLPYEETMKREIQKYLASGKMTDILVLASERMFRSYMETLRDD